jgi:hypothetical protein
MEGSEEHEAINGENQDLAIEIKQQVCVRPGLDLIAKINEKSRSGYNTCDLMQSHDECSTCAWTEITRHKW